jgi:hypothetical protein
MKLNKPTLIHKHIVPETWKEFLPLPECLAHQVLDIVDNGEMCQFLTDHLDPGGTLMTCHGGVFTRCMKSLYSIIRAKPTMRFWLLAIIEDQCQDAGQCPPVGKYAKAKPLLDLAKVAKILRYDFVEAPKAEFRQDLYLNTKPATESTSSMWPKPKDNDFIAIVGWRFLKDMCQTAGVVSTLSF